MNTCPGKYLTVFRRRAPDSTFKILFFIDAPDDNLAPNNWLQPTLAGITHNFAAPVGYRDNCGQQEEQGHSVSGTALVTPIPKDYILANELADLTLESLTFLFFVNTK